MFLINPVKINALEPTNIEMSYASFQKWMKIVEIIELWVCIMAHSPRIMHAVSVFIVITHLCEAIRFCQFTS